MSRRRKQPNRKTSRVTPPRSAAASASPPRPDALEPLQLSLDAVPPEPVQTHTPPAPPQGDGPALHLGRARESRDPQGLGEAYTLAFPADGNAGKLLRDAHELLAPRPPLRADDPAEYRRAIERRMEDMRRAAELEEVAWELRLVEREAAVQRRRIERKQRTLERAAEREAKRAAGVLYADEKRRPNRPCHAEVDPDVWRVLKAEALRRRQTIGVLAGAVVASATEHPLPRSALERGAPQAQQRFVRLIGVDDETWQAFRVRASDAGVTVGRALGAVFASEARRVGRRG